MAEKKKSWFGRLFGGKKDESTNDIAKIAPETTTSELEEQHEQVTVTNTTISESVNETVQENREAPAAGVKEDRVVDTIIEAVKEEIHESIVPTNKNDIAPTEESIAPTHQFIDDIAQNAKTEIEAAHVQFKEAPAIVEEAHEAAIPDEAIEEITKAEEVIVETPAASEIVEPIQAETPEIIEETSNEVPVTEDAIITEPIKEDVAAITDTEIADTPSESFIETPTDTIVEDTVQEALDDTSLIVTEAAVTTAETEELQEKPQKKAGFFSRLSSKLSKTRNNLTEGIADLFLGKKEINEDILEELETRLLMADVGIKVTDQMLTSIRDSVSRKSLSNVDELFTALKVQMKDILEPVSQPLIIDTNHKPYVILMIGVNGVGKTTTIGKLAKKFQAEGKSVMLAAGDTFRAAAVEQLEIWGERNKIPVVSQKEGADPASVIFDAMESAKSKKVDILIADTAGRLHTDSGLMQELAKINRVIKRHDETAPHEVMLVVDASTGQNALNQARQFNTTVPLSGITFTKLDGTAKGGIIFAIAEELNIPIRFIGVGESIDDLRPFDSDEFVDALISTEKAS